MNSQISTLKQTTEQLEHALTIGNVDLVKQLAMRLSHIGEEIVHDIGAIQQKQTGIYCKKINTIPFLYKPIYRKDPYQGDFLIRFNAERSEQLKDAGVIDVHNRFWTDHQVLNGNVFGSVPRELIDSTAVERLLRVGWDEVAVEIVDFGKRVSDTRQIYDFCKENFEKFIFINEVRTDAKLALHFAIS